MLFKTLPGSTIVGLCALFACTFTALTSEVAPVGLLLDMARAFHIQEGQAGLAISAFALMVAFGAVPLTIVTGKMDRKMLVLLSLGGYIASNLVVALAPTFLVLCLGRMIGGLAHAVLMSVVAAYAARLVPPAMTGRAISFVYGGTSLGAILGVPGSAAIGHFANWRIAMFIMTGLAALLLLFIAIKLPPVAAPSSATPGGVPAIRSREAIRNFGLVVLVDVVFFFAHNLLYTYVTPLLLQHGVADNDLSVVLLVTGSLSIVGLWLASLMVDRRPALGLLCAGVLMLVGMGLMSGHIMTGWECVVAIAIWCIGFSAIVPFVMSGAIRANATQADVAGAAINSASNVGILLGSATGGQVLSLAGFGVLTPVSLAVVLIGIGIGLVSPKAFPWKLANHH
ncbi:MAG: MFS transporter [Acetobacter aceti]|uniref:Sugar transporter n=1 Tax=Acetobacter aceti TaxID=435 RepID=A0A1U9KEX6_ACEAC|nr:MFS transporter [Acetobacter aceti]AQS84342.1 sugar transporter [Acetobacter aceti]